MSAKKKTDASKTEETKAIAETTEQIIIPAMQIKSFDLKIVGDSPLIVHAWSEKAKKMILDKQTKKASAGREAKRPVVDFAECLYWLSEKPDIAQMKDEEIMDAVQKGRFGFPTVAFKSCAIDGGYQSGAIPKKTTARAAFLIEDEFAVIDFKTIEMREDMVKIGGMNSTADIRYRPQFIDWSTILHIRYNTNVMSIAQIANLFNIGGFSIGVGEWRPSKDGRAGTFHVG